MSEKNLTKTFTLTGKMTFNCCGISHTVEVTDADSVHCPHCHIVYNPFLIPRLRSHKAIFVHGERKIARQNGTVYVGKTSYKVVAGQEYILRDDLYEIFNLSDEEVLIEFSAPSIQSPERTLVAPAKLEWFKEN